jgi:DNA-directed RNA polymerase specialized sigma subunit
VWKNYSSIIRKYPRLSLCEERRLIAKAKKGSKKEIEELVLRHIGFVIFRIYKKTFPVYIERFGEEILSEATFILYDKIKTYNLRYRDKDGIFKPVRFSSYIWKRIDGFILDSLKKELERERRQTSPDWERYECDNEMSLDLGGSRSKYQN